ncbi:hypothetical protein J0H58_35015 [bacterium]|mgnify:CR=1 FL=1|nr:hypothetical protein [bacterium]
MTGPAYRYTFAAHVPAEEVGLTLALAAVAAESLRGEAAARLDLAYAFDPAARVAVIAAGTRAGRDLAKLFTGFLRREFGEESFTVEWVAHAARPSEPAA